MLHVISNRLRYYLTQQIPQEQSGFVKGRGTRELILDVRQIIEQSREFYVPLYIAFIDYSKAFDSIDWNKLWEILQEMGVPKHRIFLIAQLYDNNHAIVRIDNHYSNKFQIKSGTR